VNARETARLKRKYEARIQACFAKWATQIKERGGATDGDVFDMTDEEYGWSLLAVKPDGTRFSIDLYLTEEKIREGLEPFKPNGVALHLSVVEEGGRILADFAPCNYSPDLWLYTRQGFENRFQMFEEANFAVSLESTEAVR